MPTVESYLINDRYLSSIAYSLLKEAKNEKPGTIFKKTIPAMLFFCLTLESQLNTYGKILFSKDYKKFRESSNLKEKVRWFLRRLGAYENASESKENKEFVRDFLINVDTMVDYRNYVVHSKNIHHSEVRELEGLEVISEKFISKPKLENDFMTLYSIEACEVFAETLSKLEQIWYLKAPELFPNLDFKKLYGISHSEIRS